MLPRKNRGKENRSRLATQIRISYLFLLLPNIVFLIFAFYNMWQFNERYNKMLNSVVVASEFSLDFKEDFDYETYLLIVGNVTPEESKLPKLLSDARGIVEGLMDVTDTPENRNRLVSAEKYLNNLDKYIENITENLSHDDRYEKNMTIWENDVQIVTALVQETINEYIYYENRQIQSTHQKSQQLYINTIKVAMVLSAFMVMAIVIISILGPLYITRPIEEQVKKEQQMLRKAEFELLQAQINPHFLYNTLDAIVWSAEAGNQKQVVKMVGSLSDFFRSSLNKGKEIVTVREELMHVRSYLEIQQIRYQDILSYKINVPEELFVYQIPKITIQPIVENALYHGIKNRRGGGTITVTGAEREDSFIIRVTDDGRGMDEEELDEIRASLSAEGNESGKIYGLYNVNERIKLGFGEEYGLDIDSTYDRGTTVTITLPKKSTEIVEN